MQYMCVLKIHLTYAIKLASANLLEWFQTHVAAARAVTTRSNRLSLCEWLALGIVVKNVNTTCCMLEHVRARSLAASMPIPNVPPPTQTALPVRRPHESPVVVRYVPLRTCTSSAGVRLSSLWDLVRVSTELRRTRESRQVNSGNSSQDLVQTEQAINLPQRANQWGQSHRNSQQKPNKSRGETK